MSVRRCIPELRVAWSRELSSSPFAAVPLVADVDADSQLDVAVVSFTGDVHVVRGADSRYDGQTRWPVRLGDDVSVHSSPLQVACVFDVHVRVMQTLQQSAI